MLSRDDNELLTRTGPGTVMGDLVRQYWIPVVESKELEPGGRVKRVMLLGERLVVFRGRSGRAGLIGEFCPHRSTSFYYGRVEENGMRCAYHGWKFGLDGQCQEMPSEPPESSFAAKVKHTAYPCLEKGGVIWAYMGPRARRPRCPSSNSRCCPRAHVHLASRAGLQRFQAMEGGIDSSHISFLHAPIDHRNSDVTQNMDRVSFGVGAAVSTGDRAPRFEVADTDYGVLIGARAVEPRRPLVLADHPVPAAVLHDAAHRSRRAHCAVALWVPMDDTHSVNWMVTWHPDRKLTDEEIRLNIEGKGRTCATMRRPPPSPTATCAPRPTGTTITSWTGRSTAPACTVVSRASGPGPGGPGEPGRHRGPQPGAPGLERHRDHPGAPPHDDGGPGAA